MTGNAPIHAEEHTQLMQLVAKVTDKSRLIQAVIIITVGADGRPMVGSDLGDPGLVFGVLQQVMMAHDQIATVTNVDVPKDN